MPASFTRRLKFEPARFSDGELILIDQRRLPKKLIYRRCRSVRTVWQSIRQMVVRGAPAIGVAAAYGVLLDAVHKKFTDKAAFLRALKSSCEFLKTARPTAVNLAWAVDRIWNQVSRASANSVEELKVIALEEAQRIHEEDIEMCFSIGRHGKSLIKSGDSVLTYCNAGGLATSGYGTALSPLYEAKRQGKRFHVFACETRPQLQGARLTVWELKKYGIPVTLICDNMMGDLMRRGKISKVITGADRIVRNGDTANKIGTYTAASLASLHGVPFYVAAPSSTFDCRKKTGTQIPIEERSADEVARPFGVAIAPAGTRVYNPAFDVTPHKLITAFITNQGILKPPYSKSLRCL